ITAAMMRSARTGRWHDRTAVQVAGVVLGLLLLGFFLVGAYHKANRPGGYDVHCFLATARALGAATDPYALDLPIPYNYPLFAATAAIPLTLLPEALVHGAWFAATLAAWVGVAVLLVGRWPLDRVPWVPLGLASLL